MPLEFNGQFTKFVQFAQTQTQAHNDKAIARDGGAAVNEGPLAGRVIKAATGDKASSLFSLFRSRANERANNEARFLFKQAVIDMFGGADLIPKSVLEAMRTGDFEKGKPLTARRIMIVKAAVERVADLVNPAVTEVKASVASLYEHADEAGRPELDKLITAMVNRAADDADVLDLVKANSFSLLRAGNAQLRSVDGVKAKVDKVKAYMDELRAAAKGNVEILRSGKAMLMLMCGKDLPPGLITTMVRAVSKMDIGAIKGLNASSSMVDVHLAAVQFDDNIAKAMDLSGAERACKDAEEKVPMRDFAAALMLARCGAHAPERIVALMNTENVKKLHTLYTDIYNRELDLPNISLGMVFHLGASALNTDNALASLFLNAQGKLGIPDGQKQKLAYAEVDDYHPYENIVAHVLFRAEKACSKENGDFRANIVGGNGPGADKVRDVYTGRFTPTAFGAVTDLKGSRKEIATGLFNRRICTECRKFARKEFAASDFFQEINTRLNVTIKLGKGAPVRLANDYVQARDQLAELVTRGAKHSFDELEPAERNKLYIAMSLLSEKAGTFASQGEMLTLDPDGRTPAIVTDGNKTQSLSLTLDDDGFLTLESHVQESGVGNITIKGKHGAGDTVVNAGPGSNVESAIRLSIPPNELDRLASLDFKSYDDTVPANHLAKPTEVRPYNTLTDNMGGEFGFKSIIVESKFKMTVN